MRYIPLHDRDGNVVAEAVVDAKNYADISQFNWHLDAKGYAVRNVWLGNGRQTTEKMHRRVMGAQKGKQVDHKNGNKLDNRRCNLRWASYAENNQNRPKHRGARGSQFKGVTPSQGRWMSRIGAGKSSKNFFLGRFDTEEAAARAYDRAALRLFGEFAHLNFQREDYL